MWGPMACSGVSDVTAWAVVVVWVFVSAVTGVAGLACGGDVFAGQVFQSPQRAGLVTFDGQDVVRAPGVQVVRSEALGGGTSRLGWAGEWNASAVTTASVSSFLCVLGLYRVWVMRPELALVRALMDEVQPVVWAP